MSLLFKAETETTSMQCYHICCLLDLTCSPGILDCNNFFFGEVFSTNSTLCFLRANQRAWLMLPLTMHSFGVLVSYMTIPCFFSWKHDHLYNNFYFCYKTKPKMAEGVSFHCAELVKCFL